MAAYIIICYIPVVVNVFQVPNPHIDSGIARGVNGVAWIVTFVECNCVPCQGSLDRFG